MSFLGTRIQARHSTRQAGDTRQNTHAVHHTAEHLDWLAAHREHPVDSLYTTALVNLPLFLTGIPISTLAYFAAFRGLWAIFIHSNVRLPIGPIRLLIGAPELHHWHHDRDRFAGNYANLSPIMDLIFGTYRCPDHEPSSFGIEEPIQQSYIGLLWYPFRRRLTDRCSATQKNGTENRLNQLTEQRSG